MEGKELNLNEDKYKSSNDGFIDRSRVKILLCDNDSKSCDEVFRLLLRCSYQVTSVKSARQVIDALNAEGPDIDIILSEVDLPMGKGMKMLKYIARDKELRRIPVIMMSAQDEVSIVVKCLRLGAADYLVKPLRTNELLNLWTHMWRRRRMLGLVEKNIMSYDFDIMASDPSDANTNSTTLFSDDTDDKSHRSANPETVMAMQPEDESNAAAADGGSGNELSHTHVSVYQPDVPGISDRITDRRTELAGNLSSGPKKSELRIGESSAFFTYVKSSIARSNSPRIGPVDENSTQRGKVKDKNQECSSEDATDLPLHDNGEIWERHSREDLLYSNGIPDSLSLERSCTPPTSTDHSLKRDSEEKDLPQGMLYPKTSSRGPELDVSHLLPQHTYPYYMSGVMNQVMMPSSAHLYPNNMKDMQNHAMIAQYNQHIPQCSPHTNGMTSFPCYPVGYCLPPGQMSANHSWPSFGNSSTSEVKISQVDRREAALIKFRQKRKERCFDKKIRYVNRKHLAERRPRVRGQFVRKVNGVNVDLNGEPTSADFEGEDEEDEEDCAGRESPPEDHD